MMLFFFLGNSNIQAQLVVTGLDNGPGSLRQQVDLSVSGDVILISDLVLNIEINSEIEINKDLTILGLSIDNVIIDANSMSRIFNVTSGSLTLGNLTMTNGEAENGGAIYNSGAVIINGCTITNSSAIGASGSGGAVFNDQNGTLLATNTEFTGNTAIRAGGAIEHQSSADSSLILTNVIMLNNIAGNDTAAAPGNGGGLHITGSGNSIIDSCQIAGNSAALEGGGLWNGSGVMTVTNTTITSNSAAGAMANEGGGGIFNAGGTLLVEGSVITENTVTGASASGGGILNDLGTLTVLNTEITGNSSIRAGGGIEDNSAAGSVLTLTEVTLSNNTTASAPGNGGGLHISGPGNSMISGSTITGNSASLEGGGLWNGSGAMVVSSSIIDSNISSGAGTDNGGAGIFNAGGSLTVMGSSISGNEDMGAEGNGAGIHNDANGELTIMLSTISGNTSNQGGGVYNNGSTCSINASTIAFNNAAISGGGISSMTETTIKNSIVASNSSDAGVDVSGNVTSQNYNLIGNDDQDSFDGESDDQEDVDPRLEPLSIESNQTAKHSLQQGSPAYNGGDPNDMFEDQNGQPVFGGRRDVGSDEAQTNLVSTKDISSSESGIMLYPNPVVNDLIIDIPSKFGTDIMYRVYDLSTGRLFYSNTVEQGLSSVKVSNLLAGSYFLRIQSNEFVTTQAFIKVD
tara:strand:- start:329 stop:2389 length:2061 start_codon:yes stop_codon:yes gene_type:complete